MWWWNCCLFNCVCYYLVIEACRNYVLILCSSFVLNQDRDYSVSWIFLGSYAFSVLDCAMFRILVLVSVSVLDDLEMVLLLNPLKWSSNLGVGDILTSKVTTFITEFPDDVGSNLISCLYVIQWNDKVCVSCNQT